MAEFSKKPKNKTKTTEKSLHLPDYFTLCNSYNPNNLNMKKFLLILAVPLLMAARLAAQVVDSTDLNLNDVPTVILLDSDPVDEYAIAQPNRQFSELRLGYLQLHQQRRQPT